MVPSAVQDTTLRSKCVASGTVGLCSLLQFSLIPRLSKLGGERRPREPGKDCPLADLDSNSSFVELEQGCLYKSLFTLRRISAFLE